MVSTARRLGTIVVASVATALLLVAGITPAAHAVSDASLVVRVSTVSGAALTGATVRVIRIADETESAAVETPAKSGRYVVSGSIDSASPHTVQVTTAPTSSSNGYTQFYGGSATLDSASSFTPSAGANALDFSLQAGSLSGKTLTSSSTALKNIDVSLYRFGSSRWNLIETVTSTSTGTYAFPYLEPGSYTVVYDATRLQKKYASVYVGGRPAIGTTDAPAPDAVLTSFYVTAGKATTVNQKLLTGGSIAGTVRGGASALPGVVVRAMLLAGNPTDGFTGATFARAATATSSATGAFTVPGLSTGYYALSFDPTPAQDASFRDSYSDPALGATATQWIRVTAGATAKAPVTTLSSSTAFATVQGSLGGSPSTAAGTVRFFTLDDRQVGVASISPSGSFSVALPGGRYRYQVRPSNTAQPGVAYRPTYGTVDAHAGQAIALPSSAFAPEQAMAFSPQPTVNVASNSSGDVFTVTAATNHPTTTRLTYQWLRSGIPIFGARGASFRTGAADVGTQLSVRVGAIDLDGGENIATTVDAGALVTLGAAPELLQQPSVQPATNVTLGTVVRAVPVATSPAATNFAYQWYEDGAPAEGATSATFTVRANVSAVQVEVTPVLAGREAGLSDFSSAVAVSLKPAPVVKTAPTLASKTLATGVRRYAITAGTWSPSAASTVLWLADGQDAGSGSTFNATSEFDGMAITAQVRAQLTGYAPGIRTIVARKGTTPATQVIAPVITDTDSGAEINDDTDTVTVGDVLTLTTGVWASVDDTDTPVVTYRWERRVGSTWSSVGSGTSYTVVPADVSRELRLVSVATTRGYPVTSVTQPSGLGTEATGLETDLPAAVVTGSAIVGETLTLARDDAWLLPGVTDTFAWLACTANCADAPTNYTHIAGATSATYVVPATLASAHILGRITGSRPGLVSASIDSAPLAVTTVTVIAAVTPPQMQGLTAGGDAAVGYPLTAVTGTYNLPGVSKAFAWEYCGQGCDIEQNWWRPDGYTTTFTPGDIAWYQGGGTLRLVETVSKKGYPTATFTSAVVDVVSGRAFEVYTPVFTNSGSTVTVSGAWEPLTGIRYQWLLNGAEVGSDQPSFTVAAADSGKVLELRVRIADAAAPYSAEDFDRTYVAASGTLPTLTLGPITGTAAVSSTLTAPLPAIDTLYDISPTFNYRWYAGTTAIAGATGPTFVPTSAQRGKSVSVKVTVTAPSYTSKVYTSAARTIGYGIDVGGSVVVSTPGPVVPGAVLTATPVGYDPALYTFAYAWQANGTAIAKATKRTYTLTTADTGKAVRAVVTITRAGFTPVTRSSASTTVGTAGALVATTLPTFTGTVDGTAKARTTITVSAPKFAVAAALTYTWLRDGEVIRGATASSFVTSPSDAGTSISATVMAKAQGYDATAFEMAPVQVVEGAAATATTRPVITGKVAECSTLTASSGRWNVDGLTFSYQWMTGATPIAGATAPTFAVPNSLYAGTKLSVVVTASRAGIANGTASSVATAALGSSGC